jgi:nitrite reductase/ring-hydroxylating ferredoxin subunit
VDLTPEYIALKNKIEHKRKLIAKHKIQLNALLAMCPHEETELKESYFSGSYYDKASTDKWHQCKLCGNRGPVTTIEHSYYG